MARAMTGDISATLMISTHIFRNLGFGTAPDAFMRPSTSALGTIDREQASTTTWQQHTPVPAFDFESRNRIASIAPPLNVAMHPRQLLVKRSMIGHIHSADGQRPWARDRRLLLLAL